VSWGSKQVSPRVSATPSPSVTLGSTEKVVRAKSTASSTNSSPVQTTSRSTTTTTTTTSSSSSSTSPSAGRTWDVRVEDPGDLPGREWYIEMKKPPATACSAKGPLVLSDIAERLGMSAGEVRITKFLRGILR
jgi:hypothetical protein